MKPDIKIKGNTEVCSQVLGITKASVKDSGKKCSMVPDGAACNLINCID